MRYMFHVLFLFLSACMQGTFCKNFVIIGISPNLFLIYASIICLLSYRIEGVIVSGIFGFILDILTGRFVGLYTVMFIITGFFVSVLSEKIFNEPRFYVSAIITFCVSFFVNLFYYLIVFIALGDFNFKFAFNSIIFEGIYNAVLSIPVYFIIKRITRNFYADKGEYIG